LGGGVDGVEGQPHPLEEGHAGFAVAIDFDEAGGGVVVAGGMEDGFRGKAEVDAGGVGPGLGSDFVSHVGAGVGTCGGALFGEHGGEMARFMEQVAGIVEAVGVDDEAAGFECDAGEEGVRGERGEADGEADLAKPVEDLFGSGVEHGKSVVQWAVGSGQFAVNSAQRSRSFDSLRSLRMTSIFFK
jgi:hypothetical protein